MFFRQKIAIAFFVIFVSGFVFAGSVVAGKEARDVLALVTKKYTSISTLSAKFKQEAFYRQLNQRTKSEGDVFLKAPAFGDDGETPGQMRWEYRFPTQDVIVSDGITLWMYQPDIMQAIETDASRGPMPMIMRLLTGFSGVGGALGMEMDDEFTMDVIYDGKDKWGISLVPAYDEDAFKSIVVEISKRSFLVEGVKVTDLYGVETTVTLSDIKINPQLKQGLFRFDPPKGVTIVRP